MPAFAFFEALLRKAPQDEALFSMASPKPPHPEEAALRDAASGGSSGQGGCLEGRATSIQPFFLASSSKTWIIARTVAGL
jgi:hypothetical protein